MSVLVRVLRIKLEKNPVNKIVLAVYSQNEEIASQPSLPSTQPSIEISFLVSKEVKAVTFVVQQHVTDEKFHIIGKVDHYLYNIEELKIGEKDIRMLNLKKVLHSNVKNDLAMLAGTIAFQISRSTRRKILSELQQIQYTPRKLENEKQVKEEVEVENSISKQVQSFEGISMIRARQQIIEIVNQQSEVDAIPPVQMNDNSLYEVDNEGFITLKQTKPEIQLNQILQQMAEEPITAQQQKLKLSLDQIKEFSSIDPSKLRESAVVKHFRVKQGSPSKKPQIFQRLNENQKDHIGVNMSSNMFQVYNMCCGQEIDVSHQIEQSY